MDDSNNLKHDTKYGVYWKQDDPTPYCQVCWEDRNKALHLTKNFNTLNDPEATMILYECKVCSAEYEIRREHAKDL
jgi:hypothetical protein